MKKLILGAALLAASPAMAQDGSRMMAAMFPDPNGDGVTSKAEAEAGVATRFAQVDTDKDGKVTATERAAVPRGGRMLERADADGDGVVTLAEMKAQAGMRFDRVDTNKDGKIDKAEKDAAIAMAQQMRGAN